MKDHRSRVVPHRLPDVAVWHGSCSLAYRSTDSRLPYTNTTRILVHRRHAMFIWRADIREGSGRRSLSSRAGRSRIAAAVMATFLCLSLLPTLFVTGPARSVSAADNLPPAPMPLISRGVPAYSSSDRGLPASSANDNDYGTMWRSAGVPASRVFSPLTIDS